MKQNLKYIVLIARHFFGEMGLIRPIIRVQTILLKIDI